jgi:hypothetical protein
MSERKIGKKSAKLATGARTAGAALTLARPSGAPSIGPFGRTTLRARLALLTLAAPQPTRAGHR